MSSVGTKPKRHSKSLQKEINYSILFVCDQLVNHFIDCVRNVQNEQLKIRIFHFFVYLICLPAFLFTYFSRFVNINLISCSFLCEVLSELTKKWLRFTNPQFIDYFLYICIPFIYVVSLQDLRFPCYSEIYLL